jgi:hypothetical protein
LENLAVKTYEVRETVSSIVITIFSSIGGLEKPLGKFLAHDHNGMRRARAEEEEERGGEECTEEARGGLKWAAANEEWNG